MLTVSVEGKCEECAFQRTIEASVKNEDEINTRLIEYLKRSIKMRLSEGHVLGYHEGKNGVN